MSIFKTVFSDKFTTLMGDDNTVLSKFTNLNPYILGDGQTLRIPQMNFSPTILKGLTTNNTFDSVTTGDAEQTLSMERYYIQPLEIPNYSKMYEAFDRISGVATNLATKTADYLTTDILISVASQVDTARVLLPTSGTSGTANSPSGGNKKMVKIEDIARIDLAMDKDKLPKDGRYSVLTPQQIFELKYSSDNIQYNRFDYGQSGLASGVVFKIGNMNILSRAEVPVIDGTSGLVLPQGATYDSTDTYGILAFQTDHVGYSLGASTIDIERNQIKYATLLTFENYMLAGSIRNAGARIGLYLMKQG